MRLSTGTASDPQREDIHAPESAARTRATRDRRRRAGDEPAGRFCVLIGANGAGKTTISEALYLSHRRAFPQLPRPPAAALGPPGRRIEVEYSFASDATDEGPLGTRLQLQSGRSAPGTVATSWIFTLHRELGRVRAEPLLASEIEHRCCWFTFPRGATRSMSSRAVSSHLVELLRAQQQNRGLGRSYRLRARLRACWRRLATDGLLAGLEQRVSEHPRALPRG